MTTPPMPPPSAADLSQAPPPIGGALPPPPTGGPAAQNPLSAGLELELAEADVPVEEPAARPADAALDPAFVGHEPAITATKLLDRLLEEGVVDEEQLITILGAERHSLSLNKLELALTRSNTVTDAELAVLMGIVSGMPTITDIEDVRTVPAIDARMSRRFGIIAIDRNPLTVGIVEDLPINVSAAYQVCGGKAHELWLLTASQFDRLWSRTYEQIRVESKTTPVDDIHAVLDLAIEDSASDIHLTVGQPVWMRVDGKPVTYPTQKLTRDWMRREMVRLFDEETIKTVEHRTFDADSAYAYGDFRFRLNVGMDAQGLNLVARRLPQGLPSMDDLNLPDAIRRFADLERGLVLVTGPTGSGKTTTLAALLSAIANEQSRHLITLEDPIEYTIPTGRSLVNQREKGKHFTEFSDALRQALRQDPDVVLVGEMRDLETTRTALTAAETGHLVFGTLHTYDAASTVARMINQFSPEEQNQVRAQLSYILKGVVSQTLIKRKSGKGRVAAFEVLVATSAVANNLRTVEGVTHLRNTISTGSRDGMQTMETLGAPGCAPADAPAARAGCHVACGTRPTDVTSPDRGVQREGTDPPDRDGPPREPRTCHTCWARCPA